MDFFQVLPGQQSWIYKHSLHSQSGESVKYFSRNFLAKNIAFKNIYIFFYDFHAKSRGLKQHVKDIFTKNYDFFKNMFLGLPFSTKSSSGIMDLYKTYLWDFQAISHVFFFCKLFFKDFLAKNRLSSNHRFVQIFFKKFLIFSTNFCIGFFSLKSCF